MKLAIGRLWGFQATDPSVQIEIDKSTENTKTTISLIVIVAITHMLLPQTKPQT